MNQRPMHVTATELSGTMITKAVPHIRLEEMNAEKQATLDALAAAYLALCQQYVTLFCIEEVPNKFRATCAASLLSQRWQRVAIQQAAGIAQAWRTNRTNAYRDYEQLLADYQQRQAHKAPEAEQQPAQQSEHSKKPEREPTWKEWNVPTLRQPCLQANVNVVVLEPSEDSSFEYWLKISTLEKGKPLRVPVKLSEYHRTALAGKTINSSVTLNRRNGVWWLTLTCTETVEQQTNEQAPVVGIDVGIANFITTSTGKQYGTFHGKLRERQKRDREKRRRKAKLQACLKKKGVEKLPSTSSRSGQRLRRHVRQSINQAINQCLSEHPDAHIAYEQLSVATMRFKARAMNAYLRASNLAHIPKQLAWATTRAGRLATLVKSAYSSQECSVCFYTDRKNRPDQQTFCCRVCGNTLHADHNAALNLAGRWGDAELDTCKSKEAIKTVLMQRHEEWRKQHR